MGMFSRLFRRVQPVRHDADDGEDLVRAIHQARTDIQTRAAESIRMATVATSQSRDRVTSGNFLADGFDGRWPDQPERRT